MKHFLICMIGLTLLLAGCDTDTSERGQLHGFWQLTKMTVQGSPAEDMRQSGLTWSFQGHLLELRDANSIRQDIVADYDRQGNKLYVKDFYFVDREVGDRQVDDAETYLMPYGIRSNGQCCFDIVEITAKLLILDDQTVRLEFRKY